MMMLVAFIVFMILLFMGVPIAFSMGLGSLLGLLVSSNPLSVVGQRLFSGINSFSLMAIPFFMLSGELMDKGGISRRLVNFAHSLVGHITGGLGMVDILTSIIFAGISGSAAADTAAVGAILIPPMKERGYPAGLAAVIQATAGSLGPIIPPSLTMIIYCSLTNLSIGECFMAGVIPGLIIGLGTMIVTYFYAKKLGIKGERRATLKEVWTATKQAGLAIIMPLIIIGGIVGGVFTATEGSAIAVVYALILGVCYRNITLKSFWNIVVDSAKMSGMVVFLIGVSNILGWVMSFNQIPQAVSAALLGLTENKYLILLIMNVILLVAGTFMDVTPAILIFTPLFLPIVKTFGMHPVHFGLILVYNLCIGNITPPVGNTLFVSIKVGRTTLAKTIPYMLWYYAAILVGLLLVTYLPVLSMGLPGLAGLV